MPPTAASAAVTDAYRDRQLALRDTVTAAVAAQFETVVSFTDLAGSLDEWAAAAVSLIRLGQSETAKLTLGYLPAYVSAAGLEPPRADLDPDDYIGVDARGRPIDEAAAMAAGKVPWHLGKQHGRAAAAAAGFAAAVKLTRSSVQTSARTALAAAMHADQRVVGWHRVVSFNPCGACMALAGGRKNKGEPLRNHPSCRCTAEPILADVPERYVRPTGQQMYDQLTPSQRIDVFTGTGGAEKAAIVDRIGVAPLATTAPTGELIEVPLQALASIPRPG